MTFLGKLLVMVNVAVSLLMAFGAFGLYATSVDWGFDAARPGQAGGVLKEKQEEIKNLQSMQGAVEGGWIQARAALWNVEAARRDDLAFYVAELEHAREKATKDDPARVVVVESFRPTRDPKNKNRPKMVPAKVRGDKDKEADLAPLESRTVYDAELKKHHASNQELLEKLQKEFQEDARLTRLLFDRDTGLGLRTDLVAERQKRDGIEAERRLVQPLLVNTAVENELVLKRLDSLQERTKELEGYIRKRRLDGELTKR